MTTPTTDGLPALPELPERAGVIIVGTQVLRAFTASQMEAYGEACRRAPDAAAPAQAPADSAPTVRMLKRLLEWPNPDGTIEKAYIPRWLAEECRAALAAAQPSQPAAPTEAVPVERYVVKKESGSEWARVVDTTTGFQIAKYSVMPRKRSTRDGWADAAAHAKRLNAASTLPQPTEDRT